MRCEICDRPATVHTTDVAGGRRRERHLCERCAGADASIREAVEAAARLFGGTAGAAASPAPATGKTLDYEPAAPQSGHEQAWFSLGRGSLRCAGCGGRIDN